ncbi:hypothetical protein [Alteromonas stellipolaris]|uniref:hypothetical protein n=1 Tax=Alteromonas stellipolaris TaxID=233316 RepID=UPI001E008740|nr:hypothetical protein [Alteromonas stellipolaris]MBZ2160412.1 hypothetical protein [Alteromonas stellipolaris]MDO6536010.1 hypothetical protein [Alteromonas stellipolaris]MDO6627557.1 hypothetical protein [Alteromonas stellipolaris]
MISSVNSSAIQAGMPPRPEGQALSDTQKESVSAILSSYDPENLSSEDAASIVEQFKEAGIEPSKSLNTALNSAGFEGKNIAELAGMGKPPPPPQQQEASNLPDNSTFSITV